MEMVACCCGCYRLRVIVFQKDVKELVALLGQTGFSQPKYEAKFRKKAGALI